LSTGKSSDGGSTKGPSANPSSDSPPPAAAAAQERFTGPAAFVFFQSGGAAGGLEIATHNGDSSAEANGVRGEWSGKSTTGQLLDRPGGQTAEADGAAEEESRFALSVPDVELPGELPSPRDLAVGLVGGRARADVLPERGSRLSVVAAAVASPDLAVRPEEANHLESLFVEPLGDSLLAGALASAEAGDQAEPAAVAEEPEALAGPSLRGIALLTAGLLGALVWGLSRKDAQKESSEPQREIEMGPA
jgi:hypothetical protein